MLNIPLECTVPAALPEQPINQFSKTDNSKQELRAYCPNLYTVPETVT